MRGCFQFFDVYLAAELLEHRLDAVSAVSVFTVLLQCLPHLPLPAARTGINLSAASPTLVFSGFSVLHLLLLLIIAILMSMKW